MGSMGEGNRRADTAPHAVSDRTKIAVVVSAELASERRADHRRASRVVSLHPLPTAAIASHAMSAGLDASSERALIEWMDTHARAAAPHARGYQGSVYKYEANGRRYVVKAAQGTGLRGWLARWMLRREREIYRRLDGFTGSPRCHGLLAERYLVLDCIDGVS